MLLVKQVLRVAQTHQEPMIPYRRALDLISLDFAVETLLYSVVASLDSAGKDRPTTFGGLLNRVDQLFEANSLGPVPLRAQALRIHDLRTDAQHKAKYPTPEELQESGIYARDFIDQVAKKSVRCLARTCSGHDTADVGGSARLGTGPSGDARRPRGGWIRLGSTVTPDERPSPLPRRHNCS